MIKSIYFKTSIILILYILFTRSIFVAMIIYPNTLIALTLPTLIAALSGASFFYFFSHQFKFANVIRKRKEKEETNFIDRFIFLGKFLSCFAIGFIGGPIFAALTVHLLLPKSRYRYFYVIFISSFSIFMAIALARGTFQTIQWLTTR